MDAGRRGDEERALVTGLQTQAEWARREFFTRAHDAVFVYAGRLTPDRDLRRDWTHDALLRLAEEVADGRFAYRGPGSFWGWFRVRAPFLVLDSLRARRRQEDREQPGENVADPVAPDDPARDVERLEIAQAVGACLDAIPNGDQREALTLLLLHDRSYEEIARELGRPLNTVRTDIRRGRLALRECLVQRLELTP